jgi:hypothetical protein
VFTVQNGGGNELGAGTGNWCSSYPQASPIAYNGTCYAPYTTTASIRQLDYPAQHGKQTDVSIPLDVSLFEIIMFWENRFPSEICLIIVQWLTSNVVCKLVRAVLNANGFGNYMSLYILFPGSVVRLTANHMNASLLCCSWLHDPWSNGSRSANLSDRYVTVWFEFSFFMFFINKDILCKLTQIQSLD